MVSPDCRIGAAGLKSLHSILCSFLIAAGMTASSSVTGLAVDPSLELFLVESNGMSADSCMGNLSPPDPCPQSVDVHVESLGDLCVIQK